MLGHVAKRRVGRYDHVLFHTLPSHVVQILQIDEPAVR